MVATRTPEEVFKDIVRCFERGLGEPGVLAAEHFLYTTALQTIQCKFKPRRRLRWHLLLVWRPGWSKSYIIERFYELLGPDLAEIIADINHATLTGSAEDGIFIPPVVLEKRFVLVDEFATTIGEDSEGKRLKTDLLVLLESGKYQRRLVKYTKVKNKNNIQTDVGFGVWQNQYTFSYTTSFSLIAAAYSGSSRHFLDEAMLSRFVVVRADHLLNEKVAAHMQDVSFPQDLVQDFQWYLNNPPPINLSVNIDSDFLESLRGLTPRERFTILEPIIIARRFWGLQTDYAELLKIHKQFVTKSSISSTEDAVISALLTEGPMTAREIAEYVGVSHMVVYKILKRYKGSIFTSKRDGHKVLWYVNRSIFV